MECKNSVLLFGILLTTHQSLADELNSPLKVNNYIVPGVFASALQQGMNVPVFIRYLEDTSHERSHQQIADAVLSVKDGSFIVKEVMLSHLQNKTELSPEVKKLLNEIKDKDFGDSTKIYITKDAWISLDIKSFYIELTVNKNALVPALLFRSNILGKSSSDNIANVLNYTVGSYYNKYSGSNNASSFITLDNTISIREHHFNLNGSIYGLGTGMQSGELYRAMYEHDSEGRRLALGMVDTWNLQSIASMNALNSSRIYGVSYGNKSSTQIDDKSLSLIPVTVFLPSAGEVYVYRNKKLLSIQNFSMGSYEIDTSKLPYGVYDVDIHVVINGRVVSERTTQINKTFSRDSSVTGSVSWQLFSGMLEYNKMDYRHHDNINYGKKETWIAGAAASITLSYLSGVNIKSTMYGFDNNAVTETEANIAFNDKLSANQQILLASDGSWQSISTLNMAIPGGYGSVWGSRQFSYVGNRLPVQKDDFFTFGSTVNLKQITPYLGMLTLSRTNNRYTGNRYTNVDYNQSLFASRYATLSLRTGIQRYYYNNRQGLSDKYINLDLSLPLSTWLSAGVSSENGNMLANATLRKSFDDSVITQAGASVSKRIKSSGDKNSYDSDNYALNGYASYDTKYNAGTISATRSSENSTNISLNSQGSVAWTKDNFALSTGTQTSGVLVNTNFTERGRMTAQINGQNYPLTGKSTFISLPPYAEYNIELMNDKNSEDSVDIISGRKNQVTLYPGNIGVINPEVKQLVTVFGRIRKRTGEIAANIDIHNHIGKTKTDEKGEFAMDIDKRYPVITVIEKNGRLCEADLDISKARGAVWVGDVQCESQKQIASLEEKKGKNVY